MVRKEYEDVIFYIGPEVENSPAFSLKTLFVHGFRSIATILELAETHKCKHVKFGANDTFQRNKLMTGVVQDALNAGLKVTLEYPVDGHDFVLETYSDEILNHVNFIPMLTCQIRQMEKLGKNMCVKIDDAEFGGPNNGVWTFVSHNLLDPNRKTEWSDYGHEMVILRDEKPAKKPAPKSTDNGKTETPAPKAEKKATVKRTTKTKARASE